MLRRFAPALAAASLASLVAGCDMLGIEPASQLAAKREAESRAIGGACRHAARSIEACYEANKRADKAAVFAGWREMNDYMRENKLEPQPAPEPKPKPETTELAEAPQDEAAAERAAPAAKR